MEKTYLFILDTTGKRKATFLKGIHGKTLEDLQIKAETEYPGDTQLVGNGEEYFNQFAQGRIYINGQFIEEPHASTSAELLSVAKNEKLMTLRQLLCDTDYIAIKYAEGALTTEEFESTRLQRQKWRTAYNAIEAATVMADVEAVLW